VLCSPTPLVAVDVDVLLRVTPRVQRLAIYVVVCNPPYTPVGRHGGREVIPTAAGPAAAMTQVLDPLCDWALELLRTVAPCWWSSPNCPGLGSPWHRCGPPAWTLMCCPAMDSVRPSALGTDAMVGTHRPVAP
jgi:hypothetical protein